MNYTKTQVITFCLLDNKKKWIDPDVIELEDKSVPDDDLDYIPPSPIPNEISHSTSSWETRSVLSIYLIEYFTTIHIPVFPCWYKNYITVCLIVQ